MSSASSGSGCSCDTQVYSASNLSAAAKEEEEEIPSAQPARCRGCVKQLEDQRAQDKAEPRLPRMLVSARRHEIESELDNVTPAEEAYPDYTLDTAYRSPHAMRVLRLEERKGANVIYCVEEREVAKLGGTARRELADALAPLVILDQFVRTCQALQNRDDNPLLYIEEVRYVVDADYDVHRVYRLALLPVGELSLTNAERALHVLRHVLPAAGLVHGSADLSLEAFHLFQSPLPQAPHQVVCLSPRYMRYIAIATTATLVRAPDDLVDPIYTLVSRVFEMSKADLAADIMSAARTLNDARLFAASTRTLPSPETEAERLVQNMEMPPELRPGNQGDVRHFMHSLYQAIPK